MSKLNLLRSLVAAPLLLLLLSVSDSRAQAPVSPASSNLSKTMPGVLPQTEKLKVANPQAPPEAPESADPQSTSMMPEMAPNASGTGMTIARAVESFSELTLKGSELHAEPPLLGSREVTPDFIRELWQVRWRPNDPIDLWVILPRGVKNPPVVLYLYGYPTETDRFKSSSYCKRIVQSGAAGIGFVSALTGHRTEFRPMKDNFISKMPEALASSVHDIPMILDFLQSRGGLDMSRVGIFGQGSGGAIAILSASVEPRIKAVDLLDPWGNWPKWFAKSFFVSSNEQAEYLKPDFQKALEPLEPLRYLPQLKSQKLRIQYSDDGGVPKDAIESMLAAAPVSAQVARFPTMRRLYAESSGGRLFQWVAEKLDAHPAPSKPSQPAAAPVAPAKSKP